MTYLLDTHYMLWAVADSKKLPVKVRSTITDPTNRVIVSTISFWEVSLKYALGKIELSGLIPDMLPEICTNIGFEIQPLSHEESSSYHQLKASFHKDPFDRMLIWQAIEKDYTLISRDNHIQKYVSIGLKLFTGK